jgi:2,5-diamino-6-(ribosylamino)-4(3H)-pyrimidinone 5'-phosphate reductase
MNVDCIIGMSLDGRIDWIKDTETLQETYYGLVMTKHYDAVLCGSNTMLQAQYDENNTRKYSDQTLIVVDSKGRIHNWNIIKKQAWWNDTPIVLCSKQTPQAYLDSLKKENVHYIITGTEHIEINEAIRILEETYGISSLRIDSGGVLLGKMLRNKSVNTVTAIIAPQLTGGTTPKTIFVDSDVCDEAEITNLKLVKSVVLKNDFVALSYEIKADN